MFETVIEDRGRDAIRRLVGLFRLAAAASVLNGVIFVVTWGTAQPMIAGVALGLSVLIGVLTWAVANGLELRKRWARNAGIVIACLTLLNLGLGTIFGLIELYSLWRAQHDGQFSLKEP